MSNATFALSKAVSEKAAPVLTARLQEKALESGWPAEAARALSFDDELQLQIEEEHKEAVNLLEYGTETLTPHPVIRKFKSQITSLVMPILAEEMRYQIPEIMEQV